jgi:hypothetical protein
MGEHSDSDPDASDPPPSERLQKVPAPAKGTILRRLIFLAVMLVSLYVVWPSLVKVFSSSPDLLSLNPVWFAVMLMTEVASFACAWSLQRIALRTGKWFGVATAQIVGNAFSRIVPGGPAAGGALQYRLLVRSGLDATQVGTGLTSASLSATQRSSGSRYFRSRRSCSSLRHREASRKARGSGRSCSSPRLRPAP